MGLLFLVFSACKLTQSGIEYTGNVSITSTGKPCQPWALNEPHHIETWTRDFHENSLEDMRNFCVNPILFNKPSRPHGPWCFTMDIDTKWEYCDIPNCANTESADTSNSGKHSLISTSIVNAVEILEY